MTGEITILTVGDGDTKLTFDPDKPAEVQRAKRVVDDMLRRGFAILIEVGTKDGEPLYQRAKGFDAETAEYIIVGEPPHEETEAPEAGKPEPEPKAATRRRGRPPGSANKRPAKRQPRERRVPAASASAVAVARTAGG